MYKFLKCILLFVVFVSCEANAVVCKDVITGAKENNIPFPVNPVMMASKGPRGMVVWDSGSITRTFTCTNFTRVPLLMIASPDSGGGPLGQYNYGFKYNGTIYSIGLQNPNLDTGYVVPANYVPLTVTLTYSVVLIKSTADDTPSQGTYVNQGTFLRVGGNSGYAERRSGQIKVGEPTCVPNINGLNNVVNLPPVRSNLLSSAGKTAGRTYFSLSLQQCDASKYAVLYTFNGTPDAIRQNAFSNTGSARGVAVNIGTTDEWLITPAGPDNLRLGEIKNLNATLNLFAEYVATGEQMRPGTVTSRATVSVEYY